LLEGKGEKKSPALTKLATGTKGQPSPGKLIKKGGRTLTNVEGLGLQPRKKGNREKWGRGFVLLL